MRFSIPLILAAAGFLASCAAHPSSTDKVDAAYVTRINARLAQYTQQSAAADATFTQDMQKPPTEALKAQLLTDILIDAEVHARWAILTRFTKEAAASGQFGLMTSWLKNEVGELRRASQQTDDTASMVRVSLANSQPPKDLGKQLVDLAGQRGWQKGLAEELVTIANDVQGYETDYAGASQIDEQRRREAAQELAAYLAAPRITVEAPTYMAPLPMMAPPTFTNCMTSFMGVNCTTR